MKPEVGDGLLTSWQHRAVLWRSDAAAESVDLPGAEDLDAWVRPDSLAIDAWAQKRLATLDAMFTGWKPNASLAHKTLAEVEALHARRRVLAPPVGAWPTLPASTLRRAELLGAVKPTRVLLIDDSDGVGLLLDPSVEVDIVAPAAETRAWLTREAERLERSVSIHAELPTRGGYDLVWLPAWEPRVSSRWLAAAVTLTEPGASIYVSVRAPWEDYLFETASECGLEVRHYYRDVDHAVLPGGYPVDGGADLIGFDRTTNAKPPLELSSAEDVVRRVPHQHIDVYNLAPDKLGTDALERLADMLGAVSRSPEAVRDVSRDPERELRWWYDEMGQGVLVDLRRPKAHLRLTVLPYDPALEYAALCATLWTVGDEITRVRAIRTRRSPDGLILP